MNPVGVDSNHPRFSWQLAATSPTERNLRQTAYRILVASSSQMLGKDTGDIWDSGRINSAAQLEINFAGPPLQPLTRYWWKVKTWDQDDRPSRWSASADWYTGMLSTATWKAHWIAASPDGPRLLPAREGVDMAETRPDSQPNGSLPIFRRAFTLDKPIATAVVAISGLGQYELRVNGKNVTATVMNPGWTAYRRRVYYNVYDVKSLLKPGANVLGAMLGNGMYHVPNAKGRYTKFSGSFGQPILIAQLTVHYTDGSVTTIATNSSWSTTAGPVTFSSIYGGEDYDARKDQAGWDAPAYTATGWPSAIEVAGPGGMLVAQLLPAVIVANTYQPVHVAHYDKGVAVYDLGKNFSGWPNIVVRGPAGSSVKLLPGELLDATGHVTQASNNAHPGSENSFTYTLKGTLKGNGTERWHPQFSYNGFRYVQVELSAPSSARDSTNTAISLSTKPSMKPTVVSLSGSFLHDGVAATGHFDTSRQLFVQEHQLIDQAILSNMFSVLTDCPTREKLGWLEQTHLAATSIMYNHDVRQLYDKMADDMTDSQAASGLVPAIAPEFVAFINAQGDSTDFRDSPEWGSASILSPLAAYRFYGDKDILSRHFDTMQRYIAYLASRTHDHMLAYGLGDWFDIGPGVPGVSQLTGKGLTATAIYYQDLLAITEIARVLKRQHDADDYEKKAAEVKDAFNRALFHPETGQYDRGSQTANAMPLALGLVPDDRRRDVLENLVADIRRHNDHVTAGDIGFHYVVRALTDGGRSDVLADMLSRTDSPSYGYQLARGATSLTEAWNSDPSSSQNHFMLGHAEEWFYRGLGGIDIDFSREGAERLQVHPAPVAGVDNAEARVNTVYGVLGSSWKRAPAAVAYEVTIPAGQTATVTLPAAATARVTESGRALQTASAIHNIKQGDGSVKLVLGSGSYHFLVQD